MTIDSENIRILVVDDDRYILEAYRKILSGDVDDEGSLEHELHDLRAELLGGDSSKKEVRQYSFELCKEGREAVDLVREARDEGRPFALAFVDIVLSPGPDGIWTAAQIRRLDKDINIVIVTGRSNQSVDDIAKKVKPLDKLAYLRKPFHAAEIRQFVKGLGAKWQAERELHGQLSDQTANLVMTNIALHEEMDSHNKTQRELEESQSKVQEKTEELAGINVAMDTLFRRKTSAQRELEESIIANIKELIEPNIEKLRKTDLSKEQQKFLNIIDTNLATIVSPFMRNQTLSCFRFTPNEVNVAKLIMKGKSSKEICEVLKLKKRTVDFYREKMRKKLGILNSKISLRERLLEIDSV